jgi:hypothetical protein
LTCEGSQINSSLLGAPKQSSFTWCCAKVNKGNEESKREARKRKERKAEERKLKTFGNKAYCIITPSLSKLSLYLINVALCFKGSRQLVRGIQ